MKKYCCILFSVLSLNACSKKIIPSKTNNVAIENGNNKSGNVFAEDSSANKKTDSVTATKTSAAFLIISNGYGKILNGHQSLPADANVHFDQLQLSKGFNAQQLTNLKTRYSIIPPRVLYVNPANQLNSARGTYYVLNKKFWYWKKKDGLFYLDEKYYL